MNNREGFTLLEILIVIAIIGVLVLIFAVNGNEHLKEGKLVEMQGDAKALESQIAAYYVEHKEYPRGGAYPNSNLSMDVQKIIDQELANKKSSLTSDDLTFYEIDASHIGFKTDSTKINRYFFTDQSPLEGIVFSKEIKRDRQGLAYSGLYHEDPSADPTIKQPSGHGVCSTDPYIITTVGELQWMKNDLSASACYVLGNDINASDTKNWNGGEGFEPIGMHPSQFRGKFDGKGYTINGLYINRPTTNYVGLISNGGTVNNLTMSNAHVVGQDYVGLINGYTETSLKNISGSGEVQGERFVGGLYGTVFKGNGENFHFKGKVTGENFIGGLAGRFNHLLPVQTASNASFVGELYGGGIAGGLFGGADDLTIKNSFADVRIISPAGDTSHGGLVGLTNSRTKAENVYARGVIENAPSFSGGLSYNFNNVSNAYTAVHIVRKGVAMVGAMAASGTNTMDNYWDGQVSNVTTSAFGNERTTAQMKTQANYVGWDFVNTWAIDPAINDGYPYLKNNPPK